MFPTDMFCSRHTVISISFSRPLFPFPFPFPKEKKTRTVMVRGFSRSFPTVFNPIHQYNYKPIEKEVDAREKNIPFYV